MTKVYVALVAIAKLTAFHAVVLSRNRAMEGIHTSSTAKDCIALPANGVCLAIVAKVVFTMTTRERNIVAAVRTSKIVAALVTKTRWGTLDTLSFVTKLTVEDGRTIGFATTTRILLAFLAIPGGAILWTLTFVTAVLVTMVAEIHVVLVDKQVTDRATHVTTFLLEAILALQGRRVVFAPTFLMLVRVGVFVIAQFVFVFSALVVFSRQTFQLGPMLGAEILLQGKAFTNLHYGKQL